CLAPIHVPPPEGPLRPTRGGRTGLLPTNGAGENPKGRREAEEAIQRRSTGAALEPPFLPSDARPADMSCAFRMDVAARREAADRHFVLTPHCQRPGFCASRTIDP